MEHVHKDVCTIYKLLVGVLILKKKVETTQISSNKDVVKLIFYFSVMDYYVTNQKNDVLVWKHS